VGPRDRRWINSKLYDTEARGPFRNPFELAAAVEAARPARAGRLHAAGLRGRPRRRLLRAAAQQTRPTGQPYKLGYNQVFVDPVTAEVRGKRDSTAVSFKPETLMPFLRKLHYTLHVPAMWGSDRVGHWIMGGIALVWLLDSFCRLLPHDAAPLAPAQLAQQPCRIATRRTGGRAGSLRGCCAGRPAATSSTSICTGPGGLWVWGLIIVVAFTSFSINLNREVFFPLLSMVSKTTPGPSTLVPLAPLGRASSRRSVFVEIVDIAKAEAKRRGWTTPLGGAFTTSAAVSTTSRSLTTPRTTTATAWTCPTST
jgi:hypothetical protein